MRGAVASHCTQAAWTLLQKPRHFPPEPQLASVVQAAPGLVPRKHVFPQLTGVPASHRPVVVLQDSKPLQYEPSWHWLEEVHWTHSPEALQRKRGAVVHWASVSHSTQASRALLQNSGELQEIGGPSAQASVFESQKFSPSQ
jgi:hypothetical protein